MRNYGFVHFIIAAAIGAIIGNVASDLFVRYALKGNGTIMYGGFHRVERPDYGDGFIGTSEQ